MKAIKTVTIPRTPLSWHAEFVLKTVTEEHEKMLALVQCMCRRLEPKDPGNIPDNFDFTSWRFAELLEERLEKVEFINLLRQILEEACALKKSV